MNCSLLSRRTSLVRFSSASYEIVFGMDVCHFCSKSSKNILNTCPKCNLRYCSQTCYQNPQHLQCTEAFYKECVEQELRGKNAENRREFVDKLRRQMQGAGDEDDMIDSDDDDDDVDGTKNDEGEEEENGRTPKYLKQLESLNFDEIDEAELDRQLDAMGVGHEANSLISLLNDTEKKFLEDFMNKN